MSFPASRSCSLADIGHLTLRIMNANHWFLVQINVHFNDFPIMLCDSYYTGKRFHVHRERGNFLFLLPAISTSGIINFSIDARVRLISADVKDKGRSRLTRIDSL